MFKLGFVIVTLLVSFSMADHHGPCKKDMETFCKEAKGDRAKVHQCMQEHEAQLSPECKAQKEKVKAEMAKVHEACQADVEKFCSDVEPGEKRIMKCLKMNRKDVSDSCKEQMKELKGKMKKARKEKH